MIEARAAADLRSLEGIYRLSGQTSQIKALRLGFDAGAAPALGPATANIHSVGSLLKVSCMFGSFTRVPAVRSQESLSQGNQSNSFEYPRQYQILNSRVRRRVGFGYVIVKKWKI